MIIHSYFIPKGTTIRIRQDKTVDSLQLYWQTDTITTIDWIVAPQDVIREINNNGDLLVFRLPEVPTITHCWVYDYSLMLSGS